MKVERGMGPWGPVEWGGSRKMDWGWKCHRTLNIKRGCCHLRNFLWGQGQKQQGSDRNGPRLVHVGDDGSGTFDTISRSSKPDFLFQEETGISSKFSAQVPRKVVAFMPLKALSMWLHTGSAWSGLGHLQRKMSPGVGMHHREGKTGLTLRRLRQVLGTEPALSFTSRLPPSLWDGLGWPGLSPPQARQK